MKRTLLAALLALATTPLIYGQAGNLTCVASATPVVVRSEGLTEQIGDIGLLCSNGTPNGAVNFGFTIYLSVNVTNKAPAAGMPEDVLLTVNTGAGPTPMAVRPSVIGNAVTFSSIPVTLSATGTLSLTVSGIRAAAAQLGLENPPHIQAQIAANAPVVNPVLQTVAIPRRGLVANGPNTQIIFGASTLPSIIDFDSLLEEKTHVTSVRVTENDGRAFVPRPTGVAAAGVDSGTRILVRYSGFPQGARVFVPNAIAGLNAVTATAGGDLGLTAFGGRYDNTGSALLLARVSGANTNGAGGTPSFSLNDVPGTPLTAVSEVSLSDGAGYVVYEVLNSDPSVIESAQIPTFVAAARQPDGAAVIANAQVRLAPISDVGVSSATAPVPRFVNAEPGPDCGVLGDCNAAYFPKLSFTSGTLQFTAPAGDRRHTRYAKVENEGGGLMAWEARVTYRNGSGWLRLQPSAGINDVNMRMDAMAAGLAMGRYEATLTVDAGNAGTQSVDVVFQVTDPALEPPVVSAVVNAATFQYGAIAPGSLATIFGTNLQGATVRFDGVAARVLYSGESQINLLAPAELAGKNAAQVIVTARNGRNSQSRPVNLAPVAPGIFGILNQDSTLNSAAQPALVGSVIQIFATGLPSSGGSITAKIHDREIATPYYAGPAPGLDGVQQVNIIVPADLPAMSSEVLVCGAAPSGARVCSRPAAIILAR